MFVNKQEETIEDYVENGIDPLVVSLYQMDLDRAQFLLRSYLRVRLLKVFFFFQDFHISFASLSTLIPSVNVA